jgi:hypothetical protein
MQFVAYTYTVNGALGKAQAISLNLNFKAWLLNSTVSGILQLNLNCCIIVAKQWVLSFRLLCEGDLLC